MKNKFYILIIFFTMVLYIIMPNNVKAETNNSVIIGQTEYESLEVALENANSGDLITLLQDITVSESEAFIANLPENSTLDLNGHTITIDFMSLIFTGINITIKNGKFSSNASYAFWIGDELETRNVTVENITTNGGINIFNATGVLIRNTNAVGHDYYSVWVDEGADVTIESGNYSTQGSNGLVGIAKNNDKDHLLHILGGTFITNDNKFAVGSPYLPPEVLGGKFNTDVSSYVLEGYECIFSDGFYVVNKKVYKQEVELIPADIDKDDNKITIDVANPEETKNTFLDTLNTTDEVDIENKDVKVVMDIKPIVADENIEQSISEELNNEIGKINFADFFDISINVIDINSNVVIGNLSTLNRKINLSVALSNKLKEVKEGYKRKYYIVRKHGDDVEIIETRLSDDGKFILFETDKFSTYALVYVDEAIKENVEIEEKIALVDNPETGDNIAIYVVLEILSFFSTLVLIYFMKNKQLN